MAKEVKKTAKKDDAPKYGVEDMAKACNITVLSLRAKMRKLGIKKTAKDGTSYGWTNDAAFNADKSKIMAGLRGVKKAATKKPAPKKKAQAVTKAAA